MNISYNWLKDLIEFDLPPRAAADELTRVGLTVEGVEPVAGDHVFDIDLTSNRSDCLSHLGVARELGVITGQKLKIAGPNAVRPGDVDPDSIPFPAVLAPEIVRIDAPELCGRFTARIIRNVKVGPSPAWLVERLEAIGERSINNIADVTNYVMHELGQPMHAFDLDKLSGHRIVVRRARHGETLKTLDEVERKLDQAMLAICDADSPIAVAGIMGGYDSSITDETVNVLLEVAYFKRENIRQTSRALNLSTEASYRFERGVDIENLLRASERAAQLIAELAGGESADPVDLYPGKAEPTSIDSKDISRAVRRLTGMEVDRTECLRILSALGIGITEQTETFNRFVAPSWRHDISIEEDLVEEVARHAGYERIEELLPASIQAGEYQAAEPRKKTLRRTLTALGFDEALSYSFIQTNFDGMFELLPAVGAEPVTLLDSVIDGAIRMRPSLLPGLIEAVRLNFNHQRKDLMLFEIGRVFSNAGSGELPDEREVLGMAITGEERNESRDAAGRKLDLFDLKGSLEAALASIGCDDIKFSAEDVKHLRRGQSAAIFLNRKKVGTLGRLNEEIAADYKFKQAIYVAEIDLQTVLGAATAAVVYRPLPRFPAVVRDVSLILRRDQTYADVRAVMLSAAGDTLDSVSFVDNYEGKGMGENERSLTVRLEYRSDDRTLTEEEVSAEHDRIVAATEEKLSIKQRY